MNIYKLVPIAVNFKASLRVTANLISVNKAFFSDAWKEKQEAQQKLFINQRQKKTLSKLLHKIQQSQMNADDKEKQFAAKLKLIVKSHNIPNQQAFIAEVINLHKNS